MVSDSFLDHLPSNERRKLRKMMSPEAYEKLREKVKGPEDLEHELKKAEHLAEVHFGLESDPKMQEKLKSSVSSDIAEKGITQVMDLAWSSEKAKKQIEQGKFRLTVSSHPATHEDQLVAVPEGIVQEKIPVKVSYSDKYVMQLIGSSAKKKSA